MSTKRGYDYVVSSLKTIAHARPFFWAEQGIQGGFELALCAELAAHMNQCIGTSRFWRTGRWVNGPVGSGGKNSKGKQIDLVMLKKKNGMSGNKSDKWTPECGIEMKIHHLTYGLSPKNSVCGLIRSMNNDVKAVKKVNGVLNRILFVGIFIETVAFSNAIDVRNLNSGVRTGRPPENVDTLSYIDYQCRSRPSNYSHHSTIDIGVCRGWAVRWHVIIPIKSPGCGSPKSENGE